MEIKIFDWIQKWKMQNSENRYKTALNRLKRREDRRGDTIWVEEMGTDGKPNVYYKYDSNGRLMKHARSLYGYSVSAVEYVRFGKQRQVTGEKSGLMTFMVPERPPVISTPAHTQWVRRVMHTECDT